MVMAVIRIVTITTVVVDWQKIGEVAGTDVIVENRAERAGVSDIPLRDAGVTPRHEVLCHHLEVEEAPVNVR